MGRAPCCDKANVKKGPWSPEEDVKLKSFIEQNGTGGNWIALPQKIGLKRCGKSCRLRWLNYLRPNIKHGSFSEEEDNIICSLYASVGSRWSIIAAQLPGRTDNDIKNYWNTRLKKKLLGKQRKEQQARRVTIKQEMRSESGSFPVPGVANQETPCWPELPVVMPEINVSQEPTLMDQELIWNLLIKQGGRISDDLHGSCNAQDHQFYANSIDMLSSSSSSSLNSIDSTCSQAHNTNYSSNGAGSSITGGFSSFPVDIEEWAYWNLQLEGLESFPGMDMVNSSSAGASVTESTSWGNTGSLNYRQLLSEFETCLQSVPQDSSFADSMYYGAE